MLFNSYEFIFVFLPISITIYFFLNQKFKPKIGKIFLVLSSLFFYSWWNILYLPLILASVLFNYIVGNMLSKNNKKSILIIGIIANISLLGYFKYADFFIENINLALKTDINLLNIALPLAISFFTFQQVAYLVDSYKQETKEYDLLNYTVFVTFFPQLIAGPIVHHKEMMLQFFNNENRKINNANIAAGLYIFGVGLFKKVVIADSLSGWVEQGYSNYNSISFVGAWITTLSYTFQLYFDFSGYADMAVGLALLFNINLPINFNSPYKALNIQMFWRRWHMTLSRFLRDYIYIPLGGSRQGNLVTYKNLLVTFIIGGFWHGAGWTFLIWGALHGIALVIYQVWVNNGGKLPTFIAWFLTFMFVNVTWVFFRAENLESALIMLKAMIEFSSFDFNNYILKFVFLIFCTILVVSLKNSNQELLLFRKNKTVTFYNYFKTVLLLGVSFIIISFQTGSEFLYFNF